MNEDHLALSHTSHSFHNSHTSHSSNALPTTPWIIERAREHGFPLAGVATVEPMDATPLRDWLEAGYGAEMDYLRRHLPLRADMTTLLPGGAKSVICVALPYPAPLPAESASVTVAKYARGADYHDVIRERLEALWREISSRVAGAEGRIFVDSGPLPERELARRAGIGWVGKHSCLIHPDFGSRFCLGEILTTLDLQATAPLPGACGDCHACLTACPTGALLASGVVDARRCLSYLTIEHRGPIPRALRPLIGSRLFGCDACQDACPHNQRLPAIASPLTPAADLLAPAPCQLLRLTPHEFNARFRATPLARAKRRGLLRNACVVLGNLREQAVVPALCATLCDPDPLLRGHAAWALGQLGEFEALRAALDGDTDAWVREEIELALAEGASRE